MSWLALALVVLAGSVPARPNPAACKNVIKGTALPESLDGTAKNDRILGLGFGMVRGFILVVIPYMFAASFVCNDVSVAIKQGCGNLTWVENAASKNLIQGTGDALFRLFQNVVPSKITSG